MNNVHNSVLLNQPTITISEFSRRLCSFKRPCTWFLLQHPHFMLLVYLSIHFKQKRCLFPCGKSLQLNEFSNFKSISIRTPIDIESSDFNYYLFWIYQGLAAAYSASTNITADTMGASLMLHAKCEIERLGILLSEVHSSGCLDYLNWNCFF